MRVEVKNRIYIFDMHDMWYDFTGLFSKEGSIASQTFQLQTILPIAAFAGCIWLLGG
jgi:hypothetical protein